MKHFKQVHSNIADQYITDDNKVMIILTTHNRNKFIDRFLDCIGILHSEGLKADLIRDDLNHHDYSVLNVHKNVDNDGVMLPQQSIFWTIAPVDEGGLGEDLNISQLNKTNKMFKKFKVPEMIFKKGKSLTSIQARERMNMLRFERKYQSQLKNTNHFNSLF